MTPLTTEGLPFGRYLLGPKIASGGMGEVYHAVQLGLGGFEKTLVLKLLLPHLADDPDCVQMFLAEAQLAAQMSHPGMVQIYDVGREAGRYYIAMELVRGVSMRTLITALARRDRQLPGDLLEYIAASLCDSLHHAHEQRGRDGAPLEVVHRDVTPHNVLLSVRGEVKLTDFGIAKARDSRTQTQPGTVRGKLEYLAPEQATTGKVDRRVDLYGAAVCLFHLATLRSPLRRATDAMTLQAVISEPTPLLRSLRPDLSPRLSDALDRAMRKNPDERFGTALELLQMLPEVDLSRGARVLADWVRDLGQEELARLDHQVESTRRLEVTRGLTGEEGPAWSPASVPARVRTAAMLGLAIGGLGLAAVWGGKQSGRRVDARGDGPAGVAERAQERDGAYGPMRTASAGTVAAAGASTGPRRAEAAATGSPPAVGAAAAETPNEPGSGGAAAAALAPKGLPPPEALASTVARAPARASAGLGRRAEAEVAQPLSRRRSTSQLVKTNDRPHTQQGYLTVDAAPWALVFVDGNQIGETPIDAHVLRTGAVVVTLRNPKTGRSLEQKVVISAGQKTFVKGDLNR